MNLFDIATEAKAVVESKKRAGKSILATTVTLPHFKGVYRRGEGYTITCKAIKGRKKVEHEVKKPLSGAFIISYFSCLAQDIVCAENRYREAHNLFAEQYEGEVKPPVQNSVYLIEALISQEGFNADEYAQGKVQGSKRILNHLKTVSEQRGLALNLDSEGNLEIEGKVKNDVLSEI